MRTFQDWIRFVLSGLLVVAIGFSSIPVAAQEEGEDAAATKAVERFQSLLERSPRRGVALDRVYDYHLERGSLDDLIKGLRERTTKDPSDGGAWMLIGLLESKRGREGESIEAFTKAVELRPADALAPLYLGQAYVVAGQTDRAAAAYEQGIARKPARQDALELFGALGRVHLRAGHPREALDAWTRLEAVVPDDRNVQEEIAATLAAEGQLDLALPRYRTLAASAKEESQKTLYRVEIADILARQNQTKEAIAEFDSLLATLNPEGWLYRDVRSRVDQTFLKSSDLDGLTRYYTAWIEKHPEDIDAMARLARLLLRQARTPEARGWLEKAVKLAPSRVDLRRGVIDLLVEEQRYPQALAQYALLDQAEPGNPDTLREWGKLILSDRSRPRKEREKEAEAVWRRLLAARPTDALAAVQVADLLRHAEMMDAAEALYRKGVELAPGEPQYREYLGELLHLRKRPEEALATWKEIAAGDRRSATSLARLAEVLTSFGYLKEAIPQIEEACALDPRDLSLRLKTAQLQAKGNHLEAALASLSAAEPLAQDDEERELILEAQLKLYEQDESLDRHAKALAEQLVEGKGPPRGQYVLARIREAERKWTDALVAIDAARNQEPRSLPVRIASARIAEQGGHLQEGIALRRSLAELDRRGRSEHLRRIAELELQIGHKPAALQAARELVASAPGNTENQEFLAGLCFRIGETEEGLQTLRKAIRLNPDESGLRLTLAGHLADRFRTQEAIEIYWQAFDKAAQLDDKLAVILKLTELSVRTTSLDRLLQRLESLRRGVSDKRELTLCLAQAHQASGDLTLARRELETLMEETSRDTPLLQQLSKLSEADGDFPSAIRYQRRLVQLAPGADTEFRLATLLSRSGKTDESSEIYVRLAGTEKDLETLLKVVDSLLGKDQDETVRAILKSQRTGDDRNWELLYREGVAQGPWAVEEATKRFEALLALPLDDDEPGIATKNRQRRSTGGSPAAAPLAAQQAAFGMYTTASRIRQTMQPQRLVAGGAVLTAQYWTPSTFGEARMGALAWLHNFASRTRQGGEFLRRFQAAAEQDDATERELWDYAYLTSVTSGGLEGQITPLARRLAKSGRPAGEMFFLQQLYLSQVRTTTNGQVTAAVAPPDLELASQALRNLARASRDGHRPPVAPIFASIVLRGLEQQKKVPEATELFRELVDAAGTPTEIATLMTAFPSLGDHETLLTAFDKFAETAASSPGTAGTYLPMVSTRLAAQIPMVGEKREEFALALLDRALDFQRQWKQSGTRRQASPPVAVARSGVAMQMVNGVLVQTAPSPAASRRFPPTNSVLDEGTLLIFDNVFSLFRGRSHDELLRKHLEHRVELAAEGNRAMEHFALACFHKWNGAEQPAQDALLQAMQSAPRDAELWLDVVRIHIQASQWNDAAMLIEQITPSEMDQTRERELLALDIAAKLGDTEMGRAAADRLFGMRLDLQNELRLATQMKRLGMDESAEAVLARSRQNAGNQPQSLLTLMQTSAAQGNMDLAEEIALQILQRAPAASSSTPTLRSGATTLPRTRVQNPSDIRAAAMAFLTSSGRLKGLITRAEARLQQSPGVPQRYEELAELFLADKQPEKAAEVYRKLIDSRPDDVELLVRLAPQLERTGQMREACDAYLLLLRRSPARIHALRVEVLECFTRTKRSAELVEFLSSLDATQLGGAQATDSLIRALVTSRELRPAAIALLRKSWGGAGAERGTLLTAFLGQADLWKTDEFLNYGTQAVIPTEAEAAIQPWFGLTQMTISGSDSQTSSLFQTLVSGTLTAGRIETLRSEVAEGIRKAPAWRAGPLIAALLDALGGEVDTSRATIERITAGTGAEAIPYAPAWLAGYILEQNDRARVLAVPLYRVAFERLRATEPRNDEPWNAGPGKRLLRLLDQLDRREEIRDLLLRSAGLASGRSGETPPAGSPTGMLAAGQQLENWKFPFEAWQVYWTILEQTMEPAAAGTAVRGSQESAPSRMARQRLGALTEGLAASHSAELLRALLPSKEARRERAVDLLLAQKPTSDGKAVFDTPWTAILESRGRLPAMVAQDRQTFAELVAGHRDEIEPRMLAAMHALAVKEPGPIEAALRDLHAFLEAAPPRKTVGADPIAEPELRRQVGLWLIAAEALVREDSRAEGRWLAARAIAAARQLPGPQETLIILEGGIELSIAGRLREDLERFLRLQLELATHRGGSREPKPERTAPLTEREFHLAMRTTLAAVEHDLPLLAGEALRECFAGGFPVVDLAANPVQPPAPPVAVSGFGPAPINITAVRTATQRNAVVDSASQEDALNRSVRSQVQALSQIWQEKKLDAAPFYDALRLLVFERASRGRILLYEDPLADAADPQSLGRELVRWGIRSGKEEELDGELATLGENATAALPAKTLRAMLAIEAGKPDHAEPLLKELTERLSKPSLDDLTVGLQAAGLAWSHETLRAAALPLIELSAKRHAAHQSLLSRGTVRLLADDYAARGRRTELAELLDGHLKQRESLHNWSNQSTDPLLRSNLRQALDYAGAIGDADWTLERLWQYHDIAVPGATTRLGIRNGRVVDLESAEEGERIDCLVPLRHAARQLAALPPVERYEKLRDWILPSSRYRALREIQGFTAGDDAEGTAAAGSGGSFGTLTLLAAAAREADRLDDLQKGLANAHQVKGSEPALECLKNLVAIAGGDASSLEGAARLLEQTTAAQRQANAARGTPRHEFLLVEAALAEGTTPATREAGRRLGRLLLQEPRAGYDVRAAHLQRLLALDAIRDLPGPEREPLVAPAWKHWTAPPSAMDRVQGRPSAWWIGEGDRLAHLTGGSFDALTFRWPVTGTFRFSFEVPPSTAAPPVACYGGLLQARQTGFDPEVTVAFGPSQQIDLADLLQDGWIRYTVAVTPEKVRYLAGDRLLYEDRRPQSGSPWLSLVVPDHRRLPIRNPKWSGEPTIPREIPLLTGTEGPADDVAGWTLDPQTQVLRQLATRRPPTGSPANQEPVAQPLPPALVPKTPVVWHLADGVLRGPRIPRVLPIPARGAGAAVAAGNLVEKGSQILASHPLQRGEGVSYEFFFEPGASEVHPLLGPWIFELAPEGVRVSRRTLVRTTQGTITERTPQPAEPQHRRGDGPLPLKAKEWNTARIERAGDQVRLSLNGQLVYERPWEPAAEPAFGFSYECHEVRAEVRNVLLTGDWPREFGDVSGTLLDRGNETLSPAEGEARGALLRWAEDKSP